MLGRSGHCRLLALCTEGAPNRRGEVSLPKSRMGCMQRSDKAMSQDDAGKRLVEYVQSLPSFVYHELGDSYGHIGATIADAVLQARRDYESYVTPRTQRIMKKWPGETTVTALLDLLKSVPASEFLNCNDSQNSRSWLAVSRHVWRRSRSQGSERNSRRVRSGGQGGAQTRIARTGNRRYVTEKGHFDGFYSRNPRTGTVAQAG
jgi:hypothetical protein